ncbi:MAG: NrsF family protein [Steroidobacteraceae bacterium]
MQTDELIASLTSDLKPAPRNLIAQLLGWGTLVGLGIALLALLVTVGVRADLATALFSWPFWMKWTYAISMALTAYILCDRMARPGGRLSWLILLPLLPLLMLGVLSIRTQLHLPEAARMATWLGHSAALCPFNIGALSIPVFAVLCRTLRRAAPTQLRTAACVAGLLSGAIAAFVYGLICTESSVSFVTTWYTLGMLLPAAIGALFGNTLLRWR